MAKKKGRRKKAKKRTQRTRSVPRSPRAVGSVQGAVAGLSAYHKRLLADRVTIDAKLAAIGQALGALGVQPTAVAARGPRAAGRARGFRAGSLKEYIARVLPGRGIMSVKDITDGVLAAGYSTRNKTLSKSVGIALTQMKDVRKIGRGRFRMA